MENKKHFITSQEELYYNQRNEAIELLKRAKMRIVELSYGDGFMYDEDYLDIFEFLKKNETC